jgi:hypothetical protein
MRTNQTARTHRPYPDLPLIVAKEREGRPALVLHGAAGPHSVADLAAHLATTHHVLTPTHPGWATTARPEWFAGSASSSRPCTMRKRDPRELERRRDVAGYAASR